MSCPHDEEKWTLNCRELPLRKSSRPWAKYGERTRDEDRKDANSARNAASCKFAQTSVGSLAHPPFKEFIAMFIIKRSRFDRQPSDLNAPPCGEKEYIISHNS